MLNGKYRNRHRIGATLLAALLVGALAGCDDNEVGVRQPTINLENEGWIDSSSGADSSGEEFSNEDSEEETLKLPSQEDLVSGSINAASDLAMTLMSRYLSYSAGDSPKGIINDLRPLASPALLSQIGSDLNGLNWENISEGKVSQFAEVTSVEVTEFNQGIPVVVAVEVVIFESRGEESEEVEKSLWLVGVAPDGLSNKLIATSLDKT